MRFALCSPEKSQGSEGCEERSPAAGRRQGTPAATLHRNTYNRNPNLPPHSHAIELRTVLPRRPGVTLLGAAPGWIRRQVRRQGTPAATLHRNTYKRNPNLPPHSHAIELQNLRTRTQEEPPSPETTTGPLHHDPSLNATPSPGRRRCSERFGVPDSICNSNYDP